MNKDELEDINEKIKIASRELMKRGVPLKTAVYAAAMGAMKYKKRK